MSQISVFFSPTDGQRVSELNLTTSKVPIDQTATSIPDSSSPARPTNPIEQTSTDTSESYTSADRIAISSSLSTDDTDIITGDRHTSYDGLNRK